MRVCMTLAVLSLATGVMARADDKAVEKEKAKLAGKWKLATFDISGKELPLGKGAEHDVTIDGDKWTVETKGANTTEKKREFTFAIDPTTPLKELDIVHKGAGKDGKDGIEKCLYTLEKDTLTVYSRLRGSGKLDFEKGRPTELKLPMGGIVQVFKRVEK